MKLSFWRTMLVLMMLTTTTAWAGSIYKWVDKDGTVHYADQAPEKNRVAGDVENRQAVAGGPSPIAPANDVTQAPDAAQPSRPENDLKNADVEIYTTSWCRYCREAKKFFRSRGIAFKEYDVEKDRAAARRLKRYNPRGGVPLTVINGQPIVGYAPPAFYRALKNS